MSLKDTLDGFTEQDSGGRILESSIPLIKSHCRWSRFKPGTTSSTLLRTPNLTASAIKCSTIVWRQWTAPRLTPWVTYFSTCSASSVSRRDSEVGAVSGTTMPRLVTRIQGRLRSGASYYRALLWGSERGPRPNQGQIVTNQDYLSSTQRGNIK